MNPIHIEAILDEFRTARWVTGNLGDLPCEGWFLLEVNPLPSGDDLNKVVKDIAGGCPVYVTDGQIRHLPSCAERHDEMTIPHDVQAVLPWLRNDTFRIAVHSGLGNAYQGQPLAVAYEPAINYEIFPDHPHLNTGGAGAILGQGFYVPDTICYEENILGLGSEPVERFLQAFARISVWLLRHMIWMETKKHCDGKGQWIGPEAPPLTPKQRAEAGFWNPSDLCRCKSGKRYSDCHMLSDLGYGILAKSISTKSLKQGITVRYEQRREQHKKFYSQIQRSS